MDQMDGFYTRFAFYCYGYCFCYFLIVTCLLI